MQQAPLIYLKKTVHQTVTNSSNKVENGNHNKPGKLSFVRGCSTSDSVTIQKI